MQAIVHSQFGPPDVLRLAEIAKPTPKEGEVLVKVRAAAVNPLDWHFVRGEPRMLRLSGKPHERVPGGDVAGHVEAVGAKVARLKPGDEVFGTCRGSFAQYACGAASHLVRKPAMLSFEQAASMGVAGCTALRALRDHGRFRVGHSVLVNGAAGGVGTFAVQIAKALGGSVTGVCSTRNVDLVRSLGAEHVVDYTREDCTRSDRRYDLILQVAGNRSVPELKRVLAPDGTLVVIGGGVGREADDQNSALGILTLLAQSLLSRFARQRVQMLLATIREIDLTFLAELAEAEKLRPVIDRTYPLAEAGAAIAYLEAGHARGKVVITV